jgi:hypothetical protein
MPPLDIGDPTPVAVVEDPKELNLFTRYGRHLELAVACFAAAGRPDWEITKATTYHWVAELNLGATPDFWITPDGILETKAMQATVWARHGGVPPSRYFAQLYTQLFVCDRAWGALAILELQVPEFPLHIFEVQRTEETDAKIIAAAADYWQRYTKGDRSITPKFKLTSTVTTGI